MPLLPLCKRARCLHLEEVGRGFGEDSPFWNIAGFAQQIGSPGDTETCSDSDQESRREDPEGWLDERRMIDWRGGEYEYSHDSPKTPGSSDESVEDNDDNDDDDNNDDNDDDANNDGRADTNDNNENNADDSASNNDNNNDSLESPSTMPLPLSPTSSEDSITRLLNL